MIAPLSKVDFKRMHKGGELLLLWAGANTKEAYASAISDKLAAGVNLSDYARNTTSHGYIDNGEHRCYIDEANGLVYLETKFTYGDKNAVNTTIYLTN